MILLVNFYDFDFLCGIIWKFGRICTVILMYDLWVRLLILPCLQQFYKGVCAIFRAISDTVWGLRFEPKPNRTFLEHQYIRYWKNNFSIHPNIYLAICTSVVLILTYISTRISGPYGPLKILAPAESLLALLTTISLSSSWPPVPSK